MRAEVAARQLREAEVAAAEWQQRAHIAQLLARRLWALLSRAEVEVVADCLSVDAVAIVDPAFDAAQRLHDRERVFVEPCRLILDEQTQSYLATWPSGEQRHLDRNQLIMLGGPAVGPVGEAPTTFGTLVADPVWTRS